MKYQLIVVLNLIVIGNIFTAPLGAKETFIEKAETVKNRVADDTKKTYRKIDDKICETINGKMSCTKKKINNRLKNDTDRIKTDTTEVINKVD
jgi:hypothetical protein